MESEREAILDKAKELVTKDRREQWGEVQESFQRIANLWNSYQSEKYFDAHDVAMFLALLKVARISANKVEVDSYYDLCGYAALAGEIRD